MLNAHAALKICGARADSPKEQLNFILFIFMKKILFFNQIWQKYCRNLFWLTIITSYQYKYDIFFWSENLSNSIFWVLLFKYTAFRFCLKWSPDEGSGSLLLGPITLALIFNIIRGFDFWNLTVLWKCLPYMAL